MAPVNILLITSDQQHYDTLGAVNPRIRTPALDRLGREGVRFSRAYCSNPVCSPARSSIITGLYPAWHHCWTIGVKLPEDVPTVGDQFQRHGYDTALIGKAHFQPLQSEPGSESIECQPVLRELDFWRRFNGPWYGFDHIETARMHGWESHAGQHYALWLEERGLANWRDYFDAWPPRADSPFAWPRGNQDMAVWDLPEPLHPTHWVGERTVAALERSAQANRPFFIWASFFDPHPPYVLPEPWASMYDPRDMVPGRLDPGELDRMPPHFRKTQEEDPDYSAYDEASGNGVHGFHSHRHTEAELRRCMACYYGMISLLDQETGRILDSLDRLGLAESTLVVFSTDHGHFLGQHGLIAKGPFHYEDMVRIPMLARWPGTIPAGRTSPALQSLVDFAPTFLRAAGFDVPGVMQGVDQLPVWRGKAEAARDHAIVENRHNPTRVHLRTLVTARYKLTVYRGADYGELFDLREDPHEVCNRWDDSAYRDIKAALLLRFVQAELEREPTRMPRIAIA
jgi:arylsulfatase A-like enzyme